ncbi:NAD-dependent epimerase/dehydratase family protein [Saccharomonospora cyanea]|uniref:NAD-dependent epimerase/dehydratase family protein n=1 Tax=Saccharomonospora cyanea TaxID=40989 RepID=UPI001E33B5C9|nr:NAD-dependent epimerase/dehydratase family protein [Saccharomonospora cyanea]
MITVVREQSPDAMVRLAALKSIRDSRGNEDDYRTTNVDSTTSLIDTLSNTASPVHVVHASTVSVYGPQQQPDEDAPTDPRNPYARTKLDARVRAAWWSVLICTSTGRARWGAAPSVRLHALCKCAERNDSSMWGVVDVGKLSA